MRRVFLIALAALLGCSPGSERAAVPAPSATGTASARPSPLFKPGEVMMFVGLGAEKGVLSRTCERDSCRTLATRPRRYLEGSDNGLVQFTADRAPRRAKVEVRRATRLGEPPIHEIELTPRTLMASVVVVPKGRHVVTLVATWPGREARWVFGITGPSGS